MKVIRSILPLGMFVSSLGAQVSAGPQFPLDEAINLARQNNPTYLQAVNNTQVDAAEVRQTFFENFLPSPRLSFTMGGNESRQSRSDVVSTSRGSSNRLSLGLTMPIFDGGQRRTQYGNLKLSADVTRIDLQQRDIELRTNITQRYFSVVTAERTVRLEEENVTKRRDSYADTKDRFRINKATQIDLISAEVDVAAAENRLEAARDAARKARLELFEQVGVSADFSVRLDSTIPEPIDVSEIDSNALVARALRSNNDLRSAEIGVEQQTRTTRQQRRWWWRPQITASANFNLSGSQRDFGAFYDPTFPENAASYSISAGYDLPNVFTTSSTVTQTDIALYDRRTAMRGQQLAVERQVRSQLIDLQGAHRDLALARRQAQERRNILAIAEERLRAGLLDYFQYQTHADNAQAAEREVLNARLRVITQQLNLESTLGGPLRP